MRLWIALLALVAACGFGSNASVDGGRVDVPLQDARACYGTSVQICFPAAPLAVNNLTTVDIDTGTDVNCETTNEQKAQYCVVVGNGLTLPVGEKITAHGSRPLVLLSVAAIDLSGDIDVSSPHDGTTIGAGANPAAAGACLPGMPATLLGGAQGGSFGTTGGDGSDPAAPALGTKATAAATVPFPTTVRGGCPGGNGTAGGAGQEGHGGNGGGAIAVIAVGPVHLDGKINASGSAGHGAPGGGGGGGGGGSGGLIWLESPTAPSTGPHLKLWANGGGGAQGSSPGTVAGSDGAESTGPTVPGVGSSGSGAGGNGGDGFTAASPGGGGQLALAGGGGGGGGGGAGYILAAGVTGAVNISPPSYVAP